MKSQQILVSSPDLRPSLYSVLEGMQKSGILGKLVTPIAVKKKSLLPPITSFLFSKNFSDRLQKRVIPEHLSPALKTFPARHLMLMAVQRLRRDRWTHAVWRWAELGFDKDVARHYAGRYEYCYGMEHASLETFRQQKTKGGKCFLRLVIAHGQIIYRMLEQQMKQWPQWVTPYHHLLLTESQQILERKKAEYEFSDLIIANSEYVRDSLTQEGIASEKVVAIPTGFPTVKHILREKTPHGPIIFLYVGQMSFRKGIPYLLEAWKDLKINSGAQLWLAGPSELGGSATEHYFNIPGVRYWGSVSSSKLKELYQQAHVFVLPTLLEGLSHAILEAMAYGLPVITTAESGIGGFLHSQENGWKIQAANTGSLKEAMEQALVKKNELESMGQASRQIAASWTVEDSNREHLSAIQKYMKLGKA